MIPLLMKISGLKIPYKGTVIELVVNVENKACLLINGIIRDTADLPKQPGSLIRRNWKRRLSSTVQTDYEWHEFVEGEIWCDQGQVQTRIAANGNILSSSLKTSDG